MKRVLVSSLAAMLAFAGNAFAEGYVSGNYTHNDLGGGGNLWSVNGRYLLGNNLMFDGGYTNADGGSDVWRIGGHGFVKNDKWLLGGFIGHQTVDIGGDVGEWTFAAEGQFYLDRMTLGGNVAWSETDKLFGNSIRQWKFGGNLRYFVEDNVSLGGGVAWARDEGSGGSTDGVVLNAGGEYQFEGSQFSVFAGYKYSDVGTSVNSFGVGIRLNFDDGTLIQHDRSGARLARPDGVFETVAGGFSQD